MNQDDTGNYGDSGSSWSVYLLHPKERPQLKGAEKMKAWGVRKKSEDEWQVYDAETGIVDTTWVDIHQATVRSMALNQVKAVIPEFRGRVRDGFPQFTCLGCQYDRLEIRDLECPICHGAVTWNMKINPETELAALMDRIKKMKLEHQDMKNKLTKVIKYCEKTQKPDSTNSYDWMADAVKREIIRMIDLTQDLTKEGG